MISVIQRVVRAEVRVNTQVTGAIGAGIAALVCVEPEDSAQVGEKLLQRLLGYRIFPDTDGKMNLSLRDTGGGLLLIPQFTLAADTRKGNRPGFSKAAQPAFSQGLFEGLCTRARQAHAPVGFGVFGADMQVELVNDGPVTFILHSH
ncbi:MAG: D-aminoacyl-tRNA deacylase [Methylococcales bacterium]|nr:D-aminoacyl-tRNA deacylase [Methylococcales bacterium]